MGNKIYPLPSRKLGFKNQIETLYQVAKIYEETSNGATWKQIADSIDVEFKQPVKAMLEHFFVPLRMVVKQDNLFLPTDEGLKFYQKILTNPGEDKHLFLNCFKFVIKESWFGETAQKTLSKSSLENFIVEEALSKECGEKLTSYRLNYKIRYLIDYLTYSGSIARSGKILSLPKSIENHNQTKKIQKSNCLYHDLLPDIFSNSPSSIIIEQKLADPMQLPVESLKKFIDKYVEGNNFSLRTNNNKELIITINHLKESLM